MLFWRFVAKLVRKTSSDSVQPNQCFSGLYRNKKIFSSGCEVYDGTKKGGGKGCDFLEHYMYFQYASGTSIALFIPVFYLISVSNTKVALKVAAPLSAPLFWKLDFSKIWTLILLWFKTDCWYSNFSFLYVQISSNIRKMWNFGIIWFIRPSKILPRLQKIAIFCNLNQHSVESDLNEIWHSFYIPMIPHIFTICSL